jgi:hypothetical protein
LELDNLEMIQLDSQWMLWLALDNHVKVEQGILYAELDSHL